MPEPRGDAAEPAGMAPGRWIAGLDIGGTYINDHSRMLCHTRPPNDNNDSKPPTVP